MGNWIVIVDDEALSLTSARKLLASEDMKISCLPSGKDLLKFMEKKDPDLILLDIMMPELDGFETFTALRKQEQEHNRSETPVIFLTGDADDETERHGLKLGAADYIRKPFNKDVLISRIKNTIKNSKRIESLTEDATKDSLTGFYNKNEGGARVKEAVYEHSGALLLLDLDSFKLVNDLYGHEKGDLILKAFAEVAKISTREGDILCRIGGDEFLFFCMGLHGETALIALTKRLNAQFEEKSKQILAEDHGIPLGISVGAVMVPQYGRDYDMLFKMADEAMYHTKKNGKHGCTLYEDSKDSYDPDQAPGEELTRIIQIIEERNQGNEALILGTDAISTVFRFVERVNSRYDDRSLVLLFIVTAKDTVDDEGLNDAIASFEEILIKAVGKSDIIMHSRKNQFFVLIPRMQEEDETDIIKRVMSNWEAMPGNSDFEIKTASQVR